MMKAAKPDGATTDVKKVTVERARISSAEWEAFALRCDTSHQGVGRWAGLWHVRRGNVPFRTLQCNFLAQASGGRIKIGQFAISIGLRQRVF